MLVIYMQRLFIGANHPDTLGAVDLLNKRQAHEYLFIGKLISILGGSQTVALNLKWLSLNPPYHTAYSFKPPMSRDNVFSVLPLIVPHLIANWRANGVHDYVPPPIRKSPIDDVPP